MDLGEGCDGAKEDASSRVFALEGVFLVLVAGFWLGTVFKAEWISLELFSVVEGQAPGILFGCFPLIFETILPAY